LKTVRKKEVQKKKQVAVKQLRDGIKKIIGKDGKVR